MLTRITAILLATILSSFVFGQEKKYQSLLWEISGNGLTKKSYMYGTMHVSDKVSYHLSDAFFESLLQADMVSNESNPETWTDIPNLYGGFYGKNQNGFYSNFYLKELTKNELYPLFEGTNYTLTGLLTRTNEMNKEYQEDTYLDMFIYRTGKKYGKRTPGLEDATTAMVNIMKGQAVIDNRDMEANAQNLKKFLKNKNQQEAMMDFYREKDLDMLDSLMTLSSPATYLKALLYERNIVMVNSMDSLMKEGSLFAAVGAAHLAGKKGMIEELRSRGYTVTPIFDEYTEVGKKNKKKIEEFFLEPSLQNKTSTDGIISIPLFKTVIENGENFESADLTNGGFINVKRMLLKDFIKKDNIRFDHKTLDSLFYENIPGEILDKKFYNEKNYLVYDIKSKTKTNNAQHYRYYITPLEIIAVIMGGEGEYVRKFESQIYDKIIVKDYKDEKVKFVPTKAGFEVEIPDYSTVFGNRAKDKLYSDIKIFGYDKKADANYFLVETTLGDINDLEDTEFELKRIHYEFYNQFDADSTNTSFESKTKFYSQSTIGEKDIHLFSTIYGTKYYLLGCINADSDKSSAFFNSFKIIPFAQGDELMTYVDSSSMFSIEIPKKINESLNYRFDRTYLDPERKSNHFIAKSERFTFASSAGTKVDLSFYRYHKYGSEENLDSIWVDFKKFIKKDFENEYEEQLMDIEDLDEALVDTDGFESMTESSSDDNKSSKEKKLPYNVSRWDNDLGFNKKDKENAIQLIDENYSVSDDKSLNILNVTASRPNSEQVIKYKGIVKDGATYLLKAMVPKGYSGDDPFIEKTFSSIKIFDTILLPTMYENKFKSFVADANSEHDSIRYSALKSIDYLDFTVEDLPELKDFMHNFEFDKDEQSSQLELYRKIGLIKDPSVIPYLEKIYKDENVKASSQLAVLNALTYQENKQAYHTILKLMEYDLPLPDDQYEISNLFHLFTYDMDHSQVLFPAIFQFYGVQEYAGPIMNFTNLVLNSNNGNAKKLKQYKKMILTNAKLEYKRLLSWKQSQESRDDDMYGYNYYNHNASAPSGKLISYMNILYAFKKEKEVAKLFDKVNNLELDNITLYQAKKQLDRDNSINDELLNQLLSKPETKYAGLQIMKQTNKTNLLSQYSEDTIALDGLIYFNKLASDKDSIEFLEKRIVNHGKKEISFFFYKIVNIEEDSYQKNAESVSCIAFISSNGKINPQAYKTFRKQSFIEDSEIVEYMRATIDESLNVGNARVTHRKHKQRNYGYDNFFYEEEYYDGDYPEDEYYEEEFYEEY